MIILVILTGLVAGLMSSVLGIGGGVVIVPVLSIFLGFSQQEAIATSLLTIAMITAINVWHFQLKRMIQWRVVLLIAFFASVASFTAGMTSTFLQQEILILIFILFLFFMIFYTLRLKEKPKIAGKSCSKSFLALKIGTTTGLVSGLTGVGGGLIATPLLLSSPVIKNEQAVPISNGVMLFTTFFAVLAFMFAPFSVTREWQVGYTHLDVAFFIFLGSLPSAWFGTKIQHKISLPVKKILLSVFIIIVLIRMFFKLYN